jgi:uncharacterized Ntn-hydrolase superfamily protein
MTFSIVGRCARTGALGVAISSSSPAVASRCAYVRAGVGAVATQNVTDPRLGPALLDALESGVRATDAIRAVVEGSAHPAYRQLSVVDSRGACKAFSGERSLGVNGAELGEQCVSAGNMLATLDVLTACNETFATDPSLDLEERLVRALEAGLVRGGEAGPVHSAGLLVARDVEWPVTDLRVDWSDDPIAGLRALWELWEPQRDDYVTRALDPLAAPSYGVAGDDR